MTVLVSVVVTLSIFILLAVGLIIVYRVFFRRRVGAASEVTIDHSGETETAVVLRHRYAPPATRRRHRPSPTQREGPTNNNNTNHNDDALSATSSDEDPVTLRLKLYEPEPEPDVAAALVAANAVNGTLVAADAPLPPIYARGGVIHRVPRSAITPRTPQLPQLPQLPQTTAPNAGNDGENVSFSRPATPTTPRRNAKFRNDSLVVYGHATYAAPVGRTPFAPSGDGTPFGQTPFGSSLHRPKPRRYGSLAESGDIVRSLSVSVGVNYEEDLSHTPPIGASVRTTVPELGGGGREQTSVDT